MVFLQRCLHWKVIIFNICGRTRLEYTLMLFYVEQNDHIPYTIDIIIKF